MKFSAAVLGMGNIGRSCIEALDIAPDATCLGVIRRKESLGKDSLSLLGMPEFSCLEDLVAQQGRPDVVLIASPSRLVPDTACKLLQAGYCTVDSFDIHSRITEVVDSLNNAAIPGKAVAVTAAGWDPGTDSVMRALFESMAPIGTTFTNFGRGRSMGHSVAVRSMPGALDATSITIPMGGGRHSRLVYVVLDNNTSLEKMTATIKADPYFVHDPLEVKAVSQEELAFVADASHGVLMERLGSSGHAANQRFTFDMRIDNPALTGQIMVSCARAATRMKKKGRFGAYTMIDLPPVLLLHGERMHNIARLV